MRELPVSLPALVVCLSMVSLFMCWEGYRNMSSSNWKTIFGPAVLIIGGAALISNLYHWIVFNFGS